MSGEDEANPSKASSEEVLHGADRLRLFGHFDFPLCWKKKTHQQQRRLNESDTGNKLRHADDSKTEK